VRHVALEREHGVELAPRCLHARLVAAARRAAAGLDYRLSVLRDACADGDAEVHRVVMDKVFPRRAEVVDVAEWAAALAAPVSPRPGSPSSRAQPAR
jgi:hypothetical protein